MNFINNVGAIYMCIMAIIIFAFITIAVAYMTKELILRLFSKKRDKEWFEK